LPQGRTAGQSEKKPIVRLKIEGDEVMKLKLAAAVLALVVASPAFAAEYYIIQSAGSKKCSIVNKKPTSDKATLVGDGTPYSTKKEARTALKAADVCKA
jgi:predicted alpha/beta hydrolase